MPSRGAARSRWRVPAHGPRNGLGLPETQESFHSESLAELCAATTGTIGQEYQPERGRPIVGVASLGETARRPYADARVSSRFVSSGLPCAPCGEETARSEEHTSELQSPC